MSLLTHSHDIFIIKLLRYKLISHCVQINLNVEVKLLL